MWPYLLFEALVHDQSELSCRRPLAPCSEDYQLGGEYAIHNPFELLPVDAELLVAFLRDVQVNGRVDAK